MRVLDRYIITELFKIFSLAVFVLLSVLLLEKVHFLSGLLLTKRASVTTIGKLMAFLTPTFLTLATPLAVLLSSLMVFSRLSADNEVTAMRSSGISIYRLLMPVALVSALACAMTLYLSVNVVHRSNFQFRSLVIEVLKTSLNMEIKERRFNTGFNNLLIYVNENDNGKLNGVFISDRRDPKRPRIIVSREGRVRSDPEKNIVTIDLTDGIIHRSGPEGVYRTIAFDSYALRMDLSEGLNKSFEKETPQMSIAELRKRIAKLKAEGKSANAEKVAIHKRYSAPLGCIALGLLGAPLGIMTHRRGTAGGFGLGVMMIVFNYLLWMIGQSLGAEGKAPPVLAIWSPNIVMGLIGAYLIVRVSKETMPSKLGLWISDRLKTLSAGAGR